MGTFIRKIGPYFVIVAGDFNVHRTEFSLVSRVVRPGHILSRLSIPYPPGEKTNYVCQSNGSWTSEIDYVLVSSRLQLEFKALFPGVCSNMAVVCDFVGMASSSGQYSKSYKHRSTTRDMRLRLSAHLGLFWWWMSKLDVHPDEWAHCYWFLADSVLVPSSVRHSAASIVSRGRALVGLASSSVQVPAWHAEVQQHMFLMGVRLKCAILQSISITAHTSSLICARSASPKPFPV